MFKIIFLFALFTAASCVSFSGSISTNSHEYIEPDWWFNGPAYTFGYVQQTKGGDTYDLEFDIWDPSDPSGSVCMIDTYNGFDWDTFCFQFWSGTMDGHCVLGGTDDYQERIKLTCEAGLFNDCDEDWYFSTGPLVYNFTQPVMNIWQCSDAYDCTCYGCDPSDGVLCT